MQTDDQKQQKKGLKWAKIVGLMMVGVFLIYLVVGFWVAPLLLKPELEERLSDLIGRRVTIETIKLNPLLLSTTTTNFTVYETEGEPFAGFQELFADAQLSSILKWALVIKEVRIQGPFGILKLLPDNKLNIDDILAKLSQPNPEPKTNGGLPRLIVEKFQVLEGSATLENLTGKEPVREVVTPIDFTLENLSTLRGQQGEYRFVGTGQSGGHFEVSGQLSVDPVRVKGRYATRDIKISHYWQHLKDLVSFQIIDGTAGASGDYTVEIIDGRINARLEQGTFQMNNFQLTAKGEKEVLIAVPSLDVQGIGADLQRRAIQVGSIQTEEGNIKSWLAADGTFKLQNMLLADLERLTKKTQTEKSKPETTPAPPWQVTLDKLEMNNWRLAFEDQSLTHPAELTADNIDAVVENISNKKDSQATLGVTMQINQTGNVRVKGAAGFDPLQADLHVTSDKIALSAFQPYVDEAVKAQIISGSIGSAGRVRYRGQEAHPQIQYEGDFSVDSVEIKDRQHAEDFIKLVQTKVDGIALDLLPNKLQVANVLIDRPHARVTIDQSGVINVVEVFAPSETAQTEGKENLLQRLVAFLIVQFKGPMPISVERVELQNFTGDFQDASIAPPYSTHVEITEASAVGLSSEPSAMADFKFKGRIDQEATIEGSGRMNPMNALQSSKVEFAMKDFDLNPVSPYSVKFIGYKIDKGTLNTDLKYQVEQDKVVGDNVILVDNLELGEKVDSPEALNLPIELGVALLKDSDGRITLQIPVEGNVKDPQFDFRGALINGLTRSIENAGSAPFASIAEIDGFKGEELRTVSFAFGNSELQGRELEKLKAVAGFLKKKKSLTLGIIGTADQQRDRTALTEEPPDQGALKKFWTTKIKKEKEPSTEQMVDDKRLEQLARQRAETVSAYLTEQAGVETKRIKLKPVQIKPAPDGDAGLVELTLSVE